MLYPRNEEHSKDVEVMTPASVGLKLVVTINPKVIRPGENIKENLAQPLPSLAQKVRGKNGHKAP
jgi:hypothetical protein